MFDVGVPNIGIAGEKTELISSQVSCPYTFATRDLRHVVPGTATEGLPNGCYQSVPGNAGYDYPFPYTWYSQTVVKTLEGTVGTLKVGAGTDCDEQPYLGVNREGPPDAIGNRITSSPSGIDCGQDCGEEYNRNQVVTLTAVPGEGRVLQPLERCLPRR